ncbi:ribbon-helix-helix protein, CopG family [Cryobacterium sp. TMT3-29-2]|uniref:ribbon-helix-helix protein, CopG family n=1 Tax=Cryobacterium sp. TMT3-29-2 TaxID=2555867 RepID=UPI0010745726|nr:ribbon-helix-helix protein, CopG family [Cryobacterium sp. TMT3-29-2]TFC83037.1 CopG family transcriptional regulator [Cryobacterium sp. TMT3-29-2]
MTSVYPTTNDTRTPRRQSAEKIVRLNVNLNNETAEALKALADERGISVTEAVRRAISVYKYIEDEVSAGHKVQIADKVNKTVTELVLI